MVDTKKKTVQPEDVEIRIRNVDPDLVRRLKILALTEKKTMRDKLLELIEIAVAKAKIS